jgi:hypothetical protein
MVQRRSPGPAVGEVGSLPFNYAGMVRRQATAPKVVVRTFLPTSLKRGANRVRVGGEE